MVARKTTPLMLVILTLVVAASVSGYASVGDSALAQDATKPAESTIEQHALGNNTTVDSVTGTMTIRMERPGETQTMEAKTWQRPPDHVRYEYTDGPAAGDVMVSNGSSFWMYNETTNTARHLRLTGENAEQIQNLTKVFQQLSDEFTAEYQGEATVSGQETYKVRLQPKNESLQQMMRNQTVWLDQDNWFPVKTQVTTAIGNDTATTTMTYSNLTYNASIPDDRFTFTPPADAKVIDVGLPETTTYSSIETAQKSVDFTIREPTSIPGDYSLKEVSVTTSNGNASVSLMYSNGSESMIVSQSPTSRTIAGGQDVSIAGNSGTYTTIGEQKTVQWSDDEYSYSVSGPLSKASLIETAESIYC
ncbi:outer membrane lipoprotein-sorting protein [Haladaptatus caseinilyticus]|uniref:outer membrane lipoprotein-sorting protein n=1 Tax=Haladaptatus caseinilyticus TaxID=2993314 RepID=UPI00224A8F22|nr:outer membrane lipoprotein-sorting protein [Haladaptatus caseinilyticus]